jgi:hypothetical protein
MKQAQLPWFEVNYKTRQDFDGARSWFLSFLALMEKNNPTKSDHIREHVKFNSHDLSCFFDGNCGQGAVAVSSREVANLRTKLTTGG